MPQIRARPYETLHYSEMGVGGAQRLSAELPSSANEGTGLPFAAFCGPLEEVAEPKTVGAGDNSTRGTIDGIIL